MHMACFYSSQLHAHQHNTRRIIKTTPQASPSGRGSPFSGTVWSGLETEACWASWGRGWWAHNPARKPKLCHGTWGAKNTFSFLLHKRWTLTKSLRCRAQTRPSPPLLPGPQITSTEGVAFTREVSGYACKKKRGKTSKTENIFKTCWLNVCKCQTESSLWWWLWHSWVQPAPSAGPHWSHTHWRAPHQCAGPPPAWGP